MMFPTGTFSLFTGIFFLAIVESNYLQQRNICGYNKGPICCVGWRNAINRPCSIPVCGGNCGDRGYCIKPDTCMCSDRITRYSCDADEQEQMQNDQAATRCPENCHGHGICENGKCLCDHGYGGVSCEVTVEAPCYAKLNRGLCDSPLQHKTATGNVTTKLTLETCCNSIGVAWGEPCQVCRTSYCGRGYRATYGACKDIDECSIPGVCTRGQCFNMEGTFTCKCPDGFTYDKDSLQCNPVKANPCEYNLHHCLPGGKCVPLPNGDYKCLCNWRYEPTQNLKSCVRKRVITFDICTLYRGSICKNGACVPRGTSYECICDEGFETSVDRKSCIHKIDMCAVHRGYLCKNGECVSLGREFYCRCDPGYTPSYDRLSCVRAITPSIPQTQDFYHSSTVRGRGEPPTIRPNEVIQIQIQHDRAFNSTSWEPHAVPVENSRPPCLRPDIRASCAGGFCLNLGGSAYRCDCLPGFVATDDGRVCKRMVEIRYTNQWQNDVKETNEDKQYVNGHTENDLQSRDRKSQPGQIYLIKPDTPCSQPEIAKKCAGGDCLNLGGTAYRCECLPGYTVSGNGRQCV